MYKDLNIAVIGDIMLDQWREGSNYKLNPESPTIDIHNPDSEYTLGGAANVARMVRGLGARVQLLGMLGEFTTYSNNILLNLCNDADIDYYFVHEQRRTTVKERIVCDGQQICRISEEDTDYISVEASTELGNMLDELTDLDGIIVADYSKGVMRDMMIHAVHHIAETRNIPVLVDPKDRLYIYKGCTIIKPNREEYRKLARQESYRIECRELDVDHLVITSIDGIIYNSRHGEPGSVKSHPVEVANVSGCGDAAAAVMLMEYIRNGNKIEGAVKLANWAASKVVQRGRTGHLDIKDLEEFNERDDRQDKSMSVVQSVDAG